MPPKADIVDKFAKDGDHDMRGGPLQDRRCTDVVCLLLFAVHAVVFWVVAILASQSGDVRRLYYPRDYRGEYCGLDKQWASDRDLQGHPWLSFSVNIPEALSGLARSLLCSDLGRRALTSGELSRACGQSWASAGLGSAPLLVTSGGSNASNAVSVLGLLGFTGLLADIGKYFHGVCTADCRLKRIATTREYVYAPDPGVSWAPAWEKLRVSAESSADPELQRAFARFRLRAWGHDVCPYPAKYCVDMPGLDYFEGPGGICMVRPDSVLVRELGSSLSGRLQDISQLALASGASELSGLALRADVYFLVSVMSIVIGLTLMVLIRFCVRPAVLAIDVGFLGSLGGLAGAASDAVQSGAGQHGVQPSTGGCEGKGGYAVQSERGREILRVCGLSLCALALAWTGLVACLWSRIQLAIAASQVSAMFVFHTPQVLLVPLAQVALGIGWTFVWCLLAGVLLSCIPAGHVPTAVYSTEAEAVGTGDAPGACNRQQPPGFAWRDELGCGGAVGAHGCWRCAPPRYFLDYRFAYAVFSLLWHSALLIAVGQCIIAGAAALWFFAPREQKARQASARASCWMALRFHLGSLAYGSLILACVQFLRLWMYFLARQSQAHKNACAELVFKVLACCLEFFERCVRFLDKNAYIQVALRGTCFCTSARNAFSLLARNCVRFGVLAVLGRYLRLLGSVYIIAMTGLAGYFALQALYPEASPAIPVLVFLLIGYIVGKLTMNVFALALDATLHCFIITEEMHHREGDFIPTALRRFLRDRDLQAEGEHAGCCICAHSCWPSRRSSAAVQPDSG